MTLARRLAKLEQAAGKGEPCAWCRLMLRRHPPDPFRRSPGRTVSCPRCGTRYRQAPPSEAPEGAGVKARVLALYSAFEPDDFYTDRRARAVWLWYIHSPYRAASDALRGEGDELKKARARQRRRNPLPGEKVDRETAKARERRAALIEEARATLRREDAERRRRLGLRFPDLERLAPRLSARAGYSDKPRVEVSRLLAFAKLEKIIFGELPAETSAAVAHWRAEWAKAKPEALRRVRDKLRLEAVNAERRAAGLREFFTVSDMEWQLKREAEERAAATPAPVMTPAEERWRARFSYGETAEPEPAGAGYMEVGVAPSAPDPSDQSSRFRVGAVRAVAGEGLVVIPDVPSYPDPTAGMRLAPDGQIVGPDGEPPETPDPARRYYTPETPEPARRYAPGGSAPARRYRPRT
jgi:hypothetical protein